MFFARVFYIFFLCYHRLEFESNITFSSHYSCCSAREMNDTQKYRNEEEKKTHRDLLLYETHDDIIK